MTYLLVILIICGSAFVGKHIAKMYVVRDLFFKEMISLCNFIKNNISFNQTKINDIFKEYEEVHDSIFIKNIQTIKNIICNKENVNTIREGKEFYFLKEEEKNIFIKFLTDFGMTNDYNECIKIDNFLKSLEELKNIAQEKRKTNEALIYKLSIAVGVVICILII